MLVLGSDVWAGRAEQAARTAAEELRLPVITNGQGRGILPPGHELLVTRARAAAFRQADLVVVVGHPAGLPARLRRPSAGPDGPQPAAVIHVVDAPDQLAGHCPLAASYAGDLAAFFDGLISPASWPGRPAQLPWAADWLPQLRRGGGRGGGRGQRAADQRGQPDSPDAHLW